MSETVSTTFTPKTLSAVTAAAPPVLTSASHGFSAGWDIYIAGITDTIGTSLLNGETIIAAAADTNTVTLPAQYDGSALDAGSDGTMVRATGDSFQLRPGETMLYSGHGSFTGTLYLEEYVNGGWVDLVTGTADTGLSGTITNKTPTERVFRFRNTLTAGVAVCTMGPVDAAEHESDGTASTTATIVTEETEGIVHRTVVQFNNTVLSFTDDAGAGQYCPLKVYDFPAGNIFPLGGVLDADIILNDPFIATAVGAIGLGTTAIDNGGDPATTEVNIIPATDIAELVAQAGPVDCQSKTANPIVLGTAGTTDADLYLNIAIDDDDLHVGTLTGLLNGKLVFSWINLGDS